MLTIPCRQLQPPNGQAVSRSGAASPVNGMPRRGTNRSRAGSLVQRFGDIAEDEPLEPPQRPTISSRLPSGQNSPRREVPGFDLPVRPSQSRSNSNFSGFEGPTSYGGGRSESPGAGMMMGMPKLTRVPTEPTQILAGRSQLRVTKRDNGQGGDVFGDDQSDYAPESPGGYEQHGRTASWSVSRGGEEAGGARKMPPPPPPVRAKKPPPPPPM